jgi:hypothetical protein
VTLIYADHEVPSPHLKKDFAVLLSEWTMFLTLFARCRYEDALCPATFLFFFT